MLPKANRLNNPMSLQVKKQGLQYFTLHLKLIFIKDAKLPENKWQIKVFKKTYPLSTDRNRAKRMIREAIKLVNPKIKPHLNIIVQLTKPLNQIKLLDLQKEIIDLLFRLGMVK